MTKIQGKAADLTLVDLSEGLKTTPVSLGNDLTEIGNSNRLVHAAKERFRFNAVHKYWYLWAGTHWSRDWTGQILALAKDSANSIYAEAVADEDRRGDLLKHAKRSCTARGVKATIELAACDERLVTTPDKMDCHSNLLTCMNGTIDLTNGDLLPHNKDQLITHCIPVDYDPEAVCPHWLSFLDRILSGDTDLIDFVQRAIGYSLTGDTREHCLFFLHGSGRNGKSTFMNLILELLSSYALRTPTETLMMRRHEGIPNDIARLDGPRLVMASEVSDGQRLNESRIKDITGGDRISARFMRGEFFDFTPRFKLWITGNHKPRITGTDDGIWRRIRLIPFTVTIPESEVDKELPDKLKAELPGILRWAVDGCLDWQDTGLAPPAAVTSATDTYRAEMDVIGDFIDQRCVIHMEAKVRAGDLYKQYDTWCRRSGYSPLNMTNFGLAIAERGYGKTKKRAGVFYVGLGLPIEDGNG